MQKQGVKVIPNGHIHQQFAIFSPCQQMEWLTPSPYNKGLTSCTTCCEFWPFGKKPQMKGKGLLIVSLLFS